MAPTASIADRERHFFQFLDRHLTAWKEQQKYEQQVAKKHQNETKEFTVPLKG